MQTTTTPADVAKAPTPGTPEYDTAMAEKFRTSQSSVDAETIAQLQGQPTTAEPAADKAAPIRPDHIPEKFWDAEKGEVRVEALAKSYADLEKARGTAPKPDGTEADAGTEAAKDAVEAAGLDWEALGSKINSVGDIDEADYAALAKVGIPAEIAKRHIELLQGERDQSTKAAYEYGGGKEAVEDLLGWAAKTLTKDQVEGYNAMLASPNWTVALDTLKTLRAKASLTSGEPNLLNTPALPGGGTAVGYQTEDDMKVDMRNPLYNQMTPAGAAFRAQVQEKVRLAHYRR